MNNLLIIAILITAVTAGVGVAAIVNAVRVNKERQSERATGSPHPTVS